jgi:hypothetical protein
VNMTGKTQVFGMEEMYDFDSKFKAKIKYYWLKLVNLFQK